MGNDELICIKNAEILHGKETVKTALEITFEDIKFNRVGFGKLTTRKYFMDIFFKSLTVARQVV